MCGIVAPIPKRTEPKTINHVSCVTYHISCGMCCVSLFTCHLSLTLTATARDPLFANSPIMHSRLDYKDTKTKIFQNANNHQNNKNPKTSKANILNVDFLALITFLTSIFREKKKKVLKEYHHSHNT